MSSASDVVGPLAPSTTRRARTRVGVAGVQHAFDRRRYQQVDIEFEQVPGVDRRGAVEPDDRARLVDVGLKGGQVDAAGRMDCAVLVGHGLDPDAGLGEESRRPATNLAEALHGRGRTVVSDAQVA